MNERKTILSDDRVYRYVLWREWSPGGYAMFIGLNPSTADETRDDPTIRKCIGFAKLWGLGALCMVNLFAFRATAPNWMKKQDNPVGEHNEYHIISNAKDAACVVAAWGRHGSHRNQDLAVRDWLSGIGVPLLCLRTNKDGSPQHPLYIPYETTLKNWVPK